ncbi:hypothetical protein RB195_004433 [Necator americanus]|uniref:Ras family protein n=1 Tax=Necator americanus TaxID=51031 RepID=A0ABR1BM16_NECAM
MCNHRSGNQNHNAEGPMTKKNRGLLGAAVAFGGNGDDYMPRFNQPRNLHRLRDVIEAGRYHRNLQVSGSRPKPVSSAAVASGIGGPSSPTRKTSWSALIEGPNRRYSIAQLVFGNSTLVRGNSGQLRDYWPDDDLDSIGSAESDYLPADNSSRRCVSAPTHELLTRPANPPKTAPLCMGRAMRVVVVGGRRVGKTAILRQVACFEDITSKKYEPTIDDTYQVLLEEGDRPREILIFHDTGGLADGGPPELKRPYLQVADAFVLVYSVADHESFNRIDLLKKFIEKQFGKDRKEVPIVALGNMRDLAHRKVDSDFAYSWAARERVKLYEVSAKDRNTLVDFVQYLGQRHFHPIKESKFSLSKKLKSEKTNVAIPLDF